MIEVIYVFEYRGYALVEYNNVLYCCSFYCFDRPQLITGMVYTIDQRNLIKRDEI